MEAVLKVSDEQALQVATDVVVADGPRAPLRPSCRPRRASRLNVPSALQYG